MKSLLRIAALVLAAAAFAAVPVAVDAAAAGKPSLTVDDCAKCHEGPPADIAVAGGAHKSDIGCIDCHGGHRPASKDNIPKCSDCHEGEKHYGLKNCLECHKNPHKPLAIILGAKVTDPCLTCHTEQVKQLKESPSKHTALFCTSCHDVHRKIPECVKCHKPHGPTMVQADCGKCHKAHQPTTLAYGKDVPNKDCGACHGKALSLLSLTKTKHGTVLCVTCHKDKHKMVPDCQMCHPQPHPVGIMKKFPKCGDCHYIAHDLNNWPEPAAKPAAKPAAPKPATTAAPKPQ